LINLDQIKTAAFYDELNKIAQEIDGEVDIHKATGLNYDDGQIDVHKRTYGQPGPDQLDMHKAKGIRYNKGYDRTDDVNIVNDSHDGVYRKDVFNGFNPNAHYIKKKNTGL
jgi:hypothetical protein